MLKAGRQVETPSFDYAKDRFGLLFNLVSGWPASTDGDLIPLVEMAKMGWSAQDHNPSSKSFSKEMVLFGLIQS